MEVQTLQKSWSKMRNSSDFQTRVISIAKETKSLVYSCFCSSNVMGRLAPDCQSQSQRKKVENWNGYVILQDCDSLAALCESVET